MFQGSIVALATPMTTEGELDKAALDRLVAFHLDSGTDAIVAMGTTGECATVSHKEHIDVVKWIVDKVAGRCPVIAGTGSNSTQEAIALTQASMEVGADACLLVTPYYNKPGQEGLYQHFREIAEHVAIPQILYNVPSRTACDLLPETVERLSHISNIVGIKEATGDLERAQTIIESCGQRIDVFSGDDGTAMELMLLGGKGDISVTANVVPAEMHALCTAAIAGDRVQAEAINNKVKGLHDALFVEANPIPVKWALYRMGYTTEGIRLPLTALAEVNHARVENAMRESGVLIQD